METRGGVEAMNQIAVRKRIWRVMMRCTHDSEQIDPFETEYITKLTFIIQ